MAIHNFGCLAAALAVTAAAAFMCAPAVNMLSDSVSRETDSIKPDETYESPSLAVDQKTGTLPLPKAEKRGDDEPQMELYFGAGCFWHVQHELIDAEVKHLKRDVKQATSRTGYAGGTATGPGGKVCYHNSQMDSDYGQLGHSEAVGLSIPVSTFPVFAEEMFNLFVDGERADPQDKGGEYRSVLGIPGGVNGPHFHIAQNAAKKRGMSLLEGQGDDGDTLGKRLVYVYDTAKFPFYHGEVYHQYRDDMVDKYGVAYNLLRKQQAEAGAIMPTGCPERSEI